jgi:transposase
MTGIVLAEKGPKLTVANLYRKYKSKFPNEYSEARFYHLFRPWFDKHEETLCAARLKEKFTSEELATLKCWRKGNDRRLWQVAVGLMTVYTYNSFTKLACRIECTQHTLLRWIRTYETGGLDALSRPGDKLPFSPDRRAAIERKMDDIIHLVRQSPKTYGIDRVSWTLNDLALVYGKQSGTPISLSSVATYLQKRGMRFRRSREVMVSNDPLFQEKYEAIQNILENLTEKEKFFSIDEYGPKSVRPKGGRKWALKGEKLVYPQVDKGKGWFICTCALELSTNQLTWFYSKKKDTGEMIKLIEGLTELYQSQEKLYLSWDAAAWHDSKELHAYLKEVNEPDYRAKLKTPEITLAPLPTKTPHLNVIESVFSGMARSVIHNSDYDSLQECMDAIDQYFNTRNQHYKENPKQAGKKIWGKEKVIPVFNKANICRAIG